MPAHPDPSLLSRSLLGLTPFEEPDPALCVALCRAGALGILDLGRDARLARSALAALAAQVPGEFGVRVPEGVSLDALDLPASVGAFLAATPGQVAPLVARAAGRPVLAQVVTVAEAREARAAGAAALVAKGSESGGRVGEETGFILLQLLLQAELGLPIWLQGGVGRNGLAAARAAGARGVLLDAQLALVRESAAPEAVKAALASMDGSETTLLEGQRVFTRPDLVLPKPGQSSRAELLARLGGRDLQSQLLPVGQEGALAASMARRYRTAGGVVRGLARASDQQLRQARDLSPLSPDSPLARAHGLRFPIAQGPMTRVSDRAAFALAVAQAGGLPFLALSLSRGEEVRRLLEETRAQLGGRPFGVGILGFVPPELRAEQLRVVEELRPKVALIAGGRPDQARSLEELGIETYLHVPSPALLDLFLADGARRFVFEGRECGGHVGPRSSLLLWEQAVERLLSHPAPEELPVFFAGGIHDARSAAMVAALAAPLAARGARLGVLLGTAYLFTEEAVATGAIGRAFQEAALRCERTVLLETAPGHATRCVESDYVEAFRARRAELEAAGKAPGEVWEELERLNLGRLRIAAKGVRREDSKLVALDPQTQRREGMFMIGQLAALRSAVVSIEELHREVSEGSDRLLRALPAPPPPSPGDSRPADVAIVGMSAIFPDAPDLKTFWANVLGGLDSVREVPRARWNPELYYDPASTGGDKTPCKWGGFLPEIPFDPISYGIPPSSLPAIDPAQLLALEAARRALQDAGYHEREFDRERTSVIFGAEGGNDLSNAYGFRNLYPQLLGPLPEKLAEHLPSLTEDSFPGVLSNVVAGRIANRLDLGGLNFTVDAACASSLAAVDLGIKELVTHGSDVVLCGGVDLHNGINDYLMFSSVHALSKGGHCRTFDAEADGIVLGEGVACLVLKRLADAERDGDRIYAVLRGVGGSSDGRSLGLTAPRKEGQVRALERAYRQAGVSPAEVGLVEAHGTGTVVGDRTELATLTEVYGRAGAPVGETALGSVKSQIGHTKCAAGLAGIVKAALALHHHVLPPTINVRRPNPGWDRAQSPFVLSTVARPWLPPAAGGTRKAAVSAFGFGGTNFHAVLAEYPRAEPPATGGPRFPAELFLLRAGTRAEAAARAGELEKRLERPLPGTLADLAFTVNGQGRGPVQLAIVAQDLGDLGRKLARARADQAGDGVFAARAPQGPVAFLFPGQGSQRTGMLGELFVAFPQLQRILELDRRVAGVALPAPGFGDDERAAQAAALTDTRIAQPALGMVELAALELLSALGVRPDLAGGHSYGELVALCAAGALSQRELILLSAERARCILDAVGDEPGAMAAVAAPLDRLRALCEGTGLVLANENSPSQGVVAGPRAALEAALERFSREGLSAQRLPVACAFHSPLLAGADAAFARALAGVELRAPALPVYSNVTAAPYAPSAGDVRALLAKQLVSPVRFAAQVEAMYAAGARTFVEVGPGQVLTRLVGRTLGERPHLALPLSRDGGGGLPQLLELLAELAVHGVPVQLAPLFAGRQVRRLDLDAAPPGKPAALWLVDGQLARPATGELPRHSLKPNAAPIAILSPAAPSSEREGSVMAYLQGMRELAEAQREVMLRYLGAPAGEAAPVRTLERIEARPTAKSEAVREGPAPESAEALGAASVDVAQLLLRLVSERTGYPPEMLSLDADLEAELSIDSIKRIEILGALTQRLGIGKGASGGSDGSLEKLSSVKTLRGISSWIEQRLAAGPSGEAAAPATAGALPPKTPSAALLHWATAELEAAPELSLRRTSGRTWIAAPEGSPVAARLAALLSERGAEVRLSLARPEGPIERLVDLTSLAAGAWSGSALWEAFARCREAVAAGAKQLLAASALGGLGGAGGGPLDGAGLAGLLQSLGRERPELSARAVDLDPAEPPERLAEELALELTDPAGPPESRWKAGARRRVELREGEPPRLGVALSKSSVVVVTGGARGITARLAVGIARRFGCALELVGSRAVPDDEPAELAGAADLAGIRQALVRRGGRLAEVEAAAQAAFAAREVRRTLAEIRAAGGRARYHALDVRSGEGVAALFERLGREGPVEAVVHAAGVTDDRAFEGKERAAFERVVETKLHGAMALARQLRPETRLFVAFGSVSGLFGNRGQVDYAAGNDALDRLVRTLDGRIAGPAVALDFGPWAGAGMVTPELAREYERRGLPLLPLAAGMDAVLAALFDAPADGAPPRGGALQLFLAAAPPSLFADRPRPPPADPASTPAPPLHAVAS